MVGFVIASRLGERSLNDRLRKRMSFETLSSSRCKMVAAVAYAHNQKNNSLRSENGEYDSPADGRLQLADFGIAKVLSAPSTGQDREPLATWPRAGNGTPEHQKRRILAGD